MDGGDDLGMRQVEKIRVPPDVAGMVAETLAAPLLLRDAATLEQHAPRAVEDDDAFLEELLESLPCGHPAS
jgi:hypothetical protein